MVLSLYSLFSLYLLSFFCCIAGAWIVVNFAHKFGLVDYPNERSSHNLPIPKGGGIGILIAFISSSLFLRIPLSFWLPATLLSAISFLGDYVEITPKIRLLAQFIASTVFLAGILEFGENQILSIIILCLLAIFVVGTTNFYNFMDGINGIAGITGVVCFGLLGFYALSESSNSSVAVLAVCVSFACLGFLPFNMPTAKVFMGDVGSILLGFVFAEMVVILSNSMLDFICIVSFLFPFYADELTTMYIRFKNNENPAVAHRIHFYQLLANEKQIPHWKISLGYGLIQLLIGINILLVKPLGIIPVLLFLLLYSCGFIILTHLLRKKIVF